MAVRDGVGLGGLAALTASLESQHANPGSIKHACDLVDSCLAANRDNLRMFFDRCFPLLLKRVFGYDDYEASWLNLVTKPGRQAEGAALVELLSPQGRLFRAIYKADADQLIKFIFPVERLPGHTQELLKVLGGREELERWPQYAGHILADLTGRTQVCLNVFEYFMFWNAFFVLGGKGVSGQKDEVAYGSRTELSQWTRSAFSDIRRVITQASVYGSHGQPLYTHPYYQLLGRYLVNFLPRPRQQAADSSRQTLGVASDASLGAVLLSVLVEFWLTDVAEPLPLEQPELAARRSWAGDHPMGSSSPMTDQPTISHTSPGVSTASPLVNAPLRVLAYQPPSEEAVTAIALLVQHVHMVVEPASAPKPGFLSEAKASVLPAQTRTPWLLETPIRVAISSVALGASTVRATSMVGAPASPAVQAISCKVYRLLRRTFAQWPVASGASLVPIINLWLTVLTPWAGPAHVRPQQGPAPAAPANPYSREWRGHVLTHLPFYLILIPRFLELIYARLSSRGDAAATELVLLLRALATAGPDLLQLLQEVETAANRFRGQRDKQVTGPWADLLPWIVDQSLDWEKAAIAGSPTQPPMQADPTFRMLTVDTGSAAFSGAAILRAARAQVQPELREALAQAMAAVLPLDRVAGPPEPPTHTAHPAVEKQYPKAGQWSAVRYKGDWLQRPVASNEISLLVYGMVWLSMAINRLLGLDQEWQGEAEEPPEHVLAQGLAWLRKRGYRFSLRFLAEMQVIGWLAGLYLTIWVCRSLLAAASQ